MIPNLPITAFEITGNGEMLRLQIDEVWGFPNQIDYADGYGAKGVLDICVGSYTVKNAIIYFSTGELYEFYIGLQKSYNDLSGVVELKNFEGYLTLKCVFDQLGHIQVTGFFREISYIRNELEFEFTIDQTQLLEPLKQLENVYKIFGDNRGRK